MADCNAKNLSEWFSSDQGGYVLCREQAYFDRTVNDIFGYNALQLGLPEYDLLRNSRIPLRFSGADQQRADVRLCADELPIATASLDLLVLAHTLEFAEQPHEILREVERVLMPEGNLIISGFNPHSLWGMHRMLAGRHGFPWCGRFIALSRLKDWLALLGFEVVGVSFAVYTPPFRQRKWLERSEFIEAAGNRWWKGSGGIYLVHAVKRVPGMRLLKPRWNRSLVKNLLPVAPKLNNTHSNSDGGKKG